MENGKAPCPQASAWNSVFVIIFSAPLLVFTSLWKWWWLWLVTWHLEAKHGLCRGFLMTLCIVGLDGWEKRCPWNAKVSPIGVRLQEIKILMNKIRFKILLGHLLCVFCCYVIWSRGRMEVRISSVIQGMGWIGREWGERKVSVKPKQPPDRSNCFRIVLMKSDMILMMLWLKF